MSHLHTPRRRSWLLGIMLLVTLSLLAACGGASNTVSSSGAAYQMPMNQHSSGNAGASSASSDQKAGQASSHASIDSPQYLIKTLKVSMQLGDTRAAADALQSWITTTDPRATSAGADYEQTGSAYTVTLSFSVQASLYPQIERYVRDYASKHGGQLLSLTETVQDVTNDYVDTQSRLSNLRTEQSRLQDLLTHAQSLGDILSIQDKLTDIEGQIETTEAHMKLLGSQTTFYTVTITIQPDASTPPPQQTPQQGWNIGQILHDAFAASLSFAQGVLSFLIWLFAFLIYLVPIAIIAFFVMRWRRRTPPPPVPKAPKPALPLSGDEPLPDKRPVPDDEPLAGND